MLCYVMLLFHERGNPFSRGWYKWGKYNGEWEIVVIIILCHRQGMYGDNDHDPLYVCVCDVCAMFPLHVASYKVKGPSPKTVDYQMEDTKEVKLESNPAYEAVTTT